MQFSFPQTLRKSQQFKASEEIIMDTRKMYRYAVRIFLTSLLLVLFSGQGWIYNFAAFAEENIFERLQINRLPEPKEAPSFSLTSVDGKQEKLSDYKGNVIFLNFWTTW